jgi:arginyl-tRNA synthetase
LGEIKLRLSAEEPLRDLTARVLKQGLAVLGIEIVEQM